MHILVLLAQVWQVGSQILQIPDVYSTVRPDGQVDIQVLSNILSLKGDLQEAQVVELTIQVLQFELQVWHVQFDYKAM